MSVQKFYDAARTILEQHNEIIGEGNEGLVDIDKFLTCLKATGGTNLKALEKISLEDLLNCLPQVDGPGGWAKPWPLAKQIKAAFRELAPDKDEADKPKFSGKKSARKMDLEELVHSFDPEEPTSAVGKRLKEISKDEPFIVYASGRQIDYDATIALLKEVKQGFEGRATYSLAGVVHRVYAVGDLPENYADENPLYRGRPLRPDGTCDQINRSWEGVPLDVRQFIAFSEEYENGIDVTGKGGRDRAHAAMDLAVTSDALSKLKERYPEIAVEFAEAQRLGNLPVLQIPLGQPIDAQEGVSGPFPVGSR